MSPDPRAAEIAKYAGAYLHPDYRMGEARLMAARRALVGCTGSLLDVGCGRGELMAAARDIGLHPVMGTEVVADLLGHEVRYAEAHDLPWPARFFDTVACLDVLEHLVPDDTEAALAELFRVARRAVLITVADFPHVYRGMELHVNRRPYAQWQALIETVGAGWAVDRGPDAGASALFRAWRVS